tara:strand:- start:239 stop:451 length:213 start_codon:yes stop_codon:yes gene_type:complete
MSKTKNDPKLALINEIIQLSKIRDEYWSYHPANPHSVDVAVEIPKIDIAIKEIQDQIENLPKPPTRQFHN